MKQKRQVQKKPEAIIAATAIATAPNTKTEPLAAPVATRPAETKRTGLLSGWLGDSDDNTSEYINDPLKAADNALESENFVSARQNYEKILLTDPGNQRATQGLKTIEQQVPQKATSSNDAYIADLLQAADNALAFDRLSSATQNYKKILQRVPGHERATTGLGKVFDQYLQLAVDEAKDDDFDDAAEYFIAAKKLRPNDNKIKTVGRKIEQ